MNILSLTRKGLIAVCVLCCLCACKKTVNQPATRLMADKIVSNYLERALKGTPYVLYLYTDTTHTLLRLKDDDRTYESERAYIYFVDEQAGSPWPHPCRSIWIDRNTSTMAIKHSTSPLRSNGGSGKWLLINNFWYEEPRMGNGDCIALSHPDYVLNPTLFYKFEGDDLKLEHQCLRIAAESTPSIDIKQAKGTVVVSLSDSVTSVANDSCLRHYGFSFHMDSLYVKIDSVNTQRSSSITFEYRVNIGKTAIKKRFNMPTSGSNKVRL